MGQKLYEHQRHQHTPQNVNQQHQAEHLSFNARLALWISSHVGSMVCAYIFAGIGIGSLVGVLTNNTLLALLCGSFSSYFLQLVLLPILALGQNILGRHAELQAEEQFATTQHVFSDSEQLVRHLHAQDEYALECGEHLKRLDALLQQQQELLLFLLDHFQITAQFDTAHHLPVVRVGEQRVSINVDALRAGLIAAGYRSETVGALDLPGLLILDKQRPRHHEERDDETQERHGACHRVVDAPGDAGADSFS